MAVRRRIPSFIPAPPDALEIQIAGEAWAVALPAVRAAVRVVIDGLPSIAQVRAEDASDADEIDELVKAALREADQTISKPAATRVAAKASKRAAAKVDADLGGQLKEVLGSDPLAGSPRLGKQLARATRQHAELISTIPRRYLRQLGDEVRRDFKRGASVNEIAARIERTYLDKNPRGPAIARLIARDQVNKLMGAQQEIRQRELGIKRYVWRTRRDERVRGNPSGRYPNAVPSHYAREGVTFPWDKPPEGGHPGQAILCRCYPVPVIDDPEKLKPKATQRARTPQALPNAPAPIVSERKALAAVDPAVARAWRKSKREQDAMTRADLERLAAARKPAPPKKKPDPKRPRPVKPRPLVR